MSVAALTLLPLHQIDRCVLGESWCCKNQYHQPVEVLWRKIYHLDEAIYPHPYRGYYSLACNHCEHPDCLKACPVGAYTKRITDGIVIQDQDKCIGCGNCIRSCPYGAPQYNPELKKAEKCNLCHERLDLNLEPACVQACPVDALELIDILKENLSETIQFPAGFPVNRPGNTILNSGDGRFLFRKKRWRACKY